ncbi:MULTISPECIES: hypothetical protein [Streptomyces]|uniref:Late embryogenesis abundant protein n=1 Tax=Streptomyces chartreusis NRRL 3882 TaxID=1079985 RepID=A0A2N9AZN9_STRCX|nr:MULTISPECIES: hypothetical protein [Streptomyces]MYS94892.1 hypothetical protein [Streptomyces sp. SID5464]SOR76539.1 hypothetical protein SCNRRL3882_0023 [Streptomyces chartreusis NRRL 3882]SOR84487.1 hypothetical protein SCNRRL3882_7932 [Streptomyces chartreusis NRRL 3882]
MSDAVQSGRVRQTGQTAKEQASATADQAQQAAGEVTATAVEQARTVAEEAREQAGTVVRDLRGRVTEETEEQARRAAGTLRQWADDLGGMAQKASGDSPARSLVTKAALKGHRAADYLENNGVGGLMEDLQGFARRRPGVFLSAATLAGVVVGRLAKAGTTGQPSQQQPVPDGEEGMVGVPEEAVRPDVPSYPGV